MVRRGPCRFAGVAMLYASLTDEQLWSAIAQNTHEMSSFVEQQLASERDSGSNERDDIKANLMRSHLEKVNRYQREYRECTAELRRRYL